MNSFTFNSILASQYASDFAIVNASISISNTSSSSNLFEFSNNLFNEINGEGATSAGALYLTGVMDDDIVDASQTAHA